MAQSLAKFREDVQALLPTKLCRPFTGAGSPFEAEAFIVGLNSATQLGHPFFERYWSDDHGFRRNQFERDYAAKRTRKGVRPRIEAFVTGAKPTRVLETNIYTVPSKKAKDLKRADKNPKCFEYLLATIRPKVVIVHSNEPIRYFESLTGPLHPEQMQSVRAIGIQFLLLPLPGPLFIRSTEAMRAYGSAVHAALCA